MTDSNRAEASSENQLAAIGGAVVTAVAVGRAGLEWSANAALANAGAVREGAVAVAISRALLERRAETLSEQLGTVGHVYIVAVGVGDDWDVPNLPQDWGDSTGAV